MGRLPQGGGGVVWAPFSRGGLSCQAITGAAEASRKGHSAPASPKGHSAPAFPKGHRDGLHGTDMGQTPTKLHAVFLGSARRDGSEQRPFAPFSMKINCKILVPKNGQKSRPLPQPPPPPPPAPHSPRGVQGAHTTSPALFPPANPISAFSFALGQIPKENGVRTRPRTAQRTSLLGTLRRYNAPQPPTPATPNPLRKRHGYDRPLPQCPQPRSRPLRNWDLSLSEPAGPRRGGGHSPGACTNCPSVIGYKAGDPSAAVSLPSIAVHQRFQSTNTAACSSVDPQLPSLSHRPPSTAVQ